MGKKGRNTRLEREVKFSSDQGERKVANSEVNPPESDSSAVNDQEQIRKLEEKVSNLEKQLLECRATCRCHAKSKNIDESNQMEVDAYSHGSNETGAHKEGIWTFQNSGRRNARKESHQGPNIEVDTYSCASNETGTRKKNSWSSPNYSVGKVRKEYQSHQETNTADSKEVEVDAYSRASNETGARKKNFWPSQNYSVGKVRKEYQSHQETNTADSKEVEYWENREQESREYQNTRDSSLEEFQDKRGGRKNPAFRCNTTYSHKTGQWSDDNRSSRNVREQKTGKCEQYEGLRICEKNGDLFTAPKDFSLAHCVGEDLTMGSGIAVTFRQVFKRVDELFGQRKKVGDVAVLEEEGRYIYYLITKKYSTGKPRLGDLEKSLYEMKKHIVANDVRKLAIPRIGCGLDRLNWNEVKEMLEYVFRGVDITIDVYNFTMDFTKSAPPRTKLRIKEEKMKLVDIERGTLLLLFGTVSGDEDETMKDINSKFPILVEYIKSARRMGDIIWQDRGQESLCILIVKESKNHNLSYSALMECLKKVLKSFKEYKMHYFGFEAIVDDDDDLITRKIITLLRIVFAHVESELWVCWPPNLEKIYDEFTSLSTQYQFGEHGRGSYRTNR